MKYHKEVDEQNSTYFDEMFDQQIDPLYQNKTLKLFRTNSFFLWKINDTLETHLFWMKCFVKINQRSGGHILSYNFFIEWFSEMHAFDSDPMIAFT